MKQAGAGSYCERCEKNVIDLTTKTDEELIQFFDKKKENVCGRLLSSQLNRKLILPPSKVSWHWLVPFTIAAFVAPHVQAQNIRPLIVQDGQASSPPPSLDPSSVKPSLLKDTVSGKAVKNRDSLAAKRTFMIGAISTVSFDQKPLYLVYAGKKSCIIDETGFSKISPDWIEKIEVLKDAKTTAVYGVRAANGVILIGIKDTHANKINFSDIRKSGIKK